VPGHTRSIYSRRQRLGPARFDNPLADFLDRLPDYFNDYQRNQLALGRQQLAEKKYEDQQERQRSLDEDAKNQRELANDLRIAGILDGEAQIKFLKSSKAPRLSQIASDLEAKQNNFNDFFSSIQLNLDDDDVINKLNEESKNTNNLYSEAQVLQIESEKNKRVLSKSKNQAMKIINQMPDGLEKESRMQRLNMASDLSSIDNILKDFKGKNTRLSSTQKQAYDKSSREYTFATDEEISQNKNLIPISGAPRQGRKMSASETINALNFFNTDDPLLGEISPADSAKYDSTKTLLIDNLISKIQEESDINIAKNPNTLRAFDTSKLDNAPIDSTMVAPRVRSVINY
tara:strand:- start:5579 stop:6613 length:1035 start_codon:yes stop_codon:yes gene_type:complete